jgi:hypothetical protein
MDESFGSRHARESPGDLKAFFLTNTTRPPKVEPWRLI